MRLIRTDRFLEHDPGPGHPEHPGRLAAIYRDLDARPLAGTEFAAPRKASDEEITRVHTADHLRVIEATRGIASSRLDSDTTTSAASAEAARLAAGAMLSAVEQVMSGESHGAFALVRPPGHHAEVGAAMGFCLYNNVAVAAQFALDHLGVKRVVIVDPDVHHGNGTQHSFYDRKDVLYISSHRYPFYPGTGWFDEVGVGRGEGYTVNLPMPGGMGDADFLHLYRRVVDPIVAAFEPELVLVSAGFDTWKLDPLGGMAVTERGFRELFGVFAGWAERHCPGRIALALEGGYDLAGLVNGVRAAVESVTGDEVAERSGAAPGGLDPIDFLDVGVRTRDVAERAHAALARYWPT